MGGVYSSEKQDEILREFSQSELQALLSSTNYTAEELIQLRVQFISDVPEGAVTSSQFFSAAACFGIVHRQHASMLFRAFDMNRDGLITFFEFARAMSMMTRGSNAEKIQLAFDMLDVDGRGELRMEAVLPLLKGMEDTFGPFYSYERTTTMGGAQQQGGAMTCTEVAAKMFQRGTTMSREDFRDFALSNPSVIRGLALQSS